jgi:LacI family transcriptional regulator, repressor for deo operon, udp, cdd, tsx, nupC, and nupG
VWTAAIQIDNRGGGELVAKHFLELGHERAAFVGLVRGVSSIAERCDGFRAAGRGGLNIEVVACDALAFQQGHERALRLLRESPETTAIFCANDEVAAGVLRAARELGRSVPGDLSIVGFDDIIMAMYTDPPLTTVSVPKEQLGRRATARLIEAVDGKPDGAREEIVPVSLAIRQSTAPARVGSPRVVTSRTRSRKGGDVPSRTRRGKALR